MTADLLETKIRALQRKVESLQGGGEGRAAGDDESPPEALSELGTALEELWVSAEELRQQSEELAAALQDAAAERQRYQELFESVPEAFLVTDLQGVIRAANPAVEMPLLRPRSFLVDKALAVFVPLADRPAFRTVVNSLARTGLEAETREIRLKGRGTTPMPVLARIAPLRQADGKLTGLRWLLRDVTVQKQSEDARRRSEATFRTMVERSVDVMAVVDSELCVRYASPSLERRLGFSPDQYLGRPFLGFAHPQEALAVAEALGAVLQEIGGERRFEQRLRQRDGDWLSVHTVATSMLSEAGEVAVLVTCRDAREMKRDEQLRGERLKAESLGLLAAGVAHDFNNLLEVILGRVDLAQRRLPPDSPARPSLEQAEVAVRRAAELAGKMLTYSGKRPFDLRPLELSAVLWDDRPLCEAGVPANVRVAWELGQSLPPVMADPGAVRQALRHLILNAAESIGELPGSVRVTTRVGELTGGPEAVGRRQFPAGPLPPGPYVLCEVRDDGPGMDEETRSRAFDPFFSTKFTGRGLGLPAVLGIMRGHHGGLAVETAPGEGTAIILAFPVAARAPAVAPPPRPRSHGATVLVVDDDELVRELLADFLAEAGLAVVVAKSGPEALDVYRARPDEFGLVLLDLTMPGMGGEETLRRLRAIDPAARIILCSGYSREEATRGFEDLNLAGFLQKPCDSTLLLEVVRAQLDRSAGG